MAKLEWQRWLLVMSVQKLPVMNQWNTYSEVEVWGKSFRAPSAASKSALEVLVASSSAIRLQLEYEKSTKEKQAALDKALAEAE